MLAIANTRDANGDHLFAGYRSDEPPFTALSSSAMSAVEAASAMDDSSESDPNALRPTAFAFYRNTKVVCADVLKSGLISDKSGI